VRTRRLGGTGIEVSVVGLGCNSFGRRVDLEGTRAVVDAALDAGINLFDTADIYGGGDSERFLGEALRGRRDRVVLATKWGMGETVGAPGSRGSVRSAAEGSLRRLETDFIDLFQYHRPDGVTPFEETLGALDELTHEGKVRAVGCSNFEAGQLEAADATARELGTVRFESVQNEYNLLERGLEADVGPLAARLRISVIPYLPLAKGLLTGKYRRGEPPPEGARLSGAQTVAPDHVFDALEALEGYARERGITMVDVAIGGLAAQPAVASVIAGATKPDQVRANAAAARWQPTREDLLALDRIVRSQAAAR
jgi:aryl-alcohol dehydrogenase-like predicted oxidoreductase